MTSVPGVRSTKGPRPLNFTFGGGVARWCGMPEYLVGICYHEPGPFALWKRGVIEDYESSTGLWVIAASSDEAVVGGERVGEVLHRQVNGDPTADWSADYSCWLEESPATCGWGHCLNFFQRVRVGEMPPLDHMGIEAYVRWQEQRHAEQGDAADGGA